MRKLILIVLFFIVTPIALGVSLFAISQTSLIKTEVKDFSYDSTSKLYAALPQKIGQVLGIITTGDARPIIIEKYLKKHNSPLLPYAQVILEASERYDVDYRLIVAIAQCESNLCKKSPPNSYNCWGFENGETVFLSWEQAINQVAKTLREEYFDKGYETPEEIMLKYAPPSAEKGGPWARCVNQFIDVLEYGKFE